MSKWIQKQSRFAAASQLNIERDGRTLDTVEFRPDGEIWPLTTLWDGYHILCPFKDLEPAEQAAIRKLRPS